MLTDALECPGTDLHAILDVLHDDLLQAIPSFLGLSITVMITTPAGATRTSLSTLSESAAVAASLNLPLTPLTGAPEGSSVRFYADRPGAFTDLAHEARASYGLDGEVVLDGHLHSPGPHHQVTPLSQTGEINQAIGALLALGHPDPAAQLDRRAARHRLTRHQAALGILTGLNASPDRPS